MKIKKYLIGIFIIIIICAFFAHSYALNPQTHMYLNQYIANNTIDGFSLDLYLQNQLQFPNGKDESFKSLKVWEWLRDGGEYEDEPPWTIPYLRSVNHFHNPLEPDIEEAGFTGIWGTGILSGESSILWSQKPVGGQSPGGYYSWHDARDYFYTALTAADKITRESNFAETFRALGQLMHLVQDISVPAHTRDDGHVMYNYETWVKNNFIEYNDLSNYLSIYPPISFDKSAIGNSNSQASVPVANLFDTNQYNGSNPVTTLQSNIGLSEYTNANYLTHLCGKKGQNSNFCVFILALQLYFAIISECYKHTLNNFKCSAKRME